MKLKKSKLTLGFLALAFGSIALADAPTPVSGQNIDTRVLAYKMATGFVGYWGVQSSNQLGGIDCGDDSESAPLTDTAAFRKFVATHCKVSVPVIDPTMTVSLLYQTQANRFTQSIAVHSVSSDPQANGVVDMISDMVFTMNDPSTAIAIGASTVVMNSDNPVLDSGRQTWTLVGDVTVPMSKFAIPTQVLP